MGKRERETSDQKMCKTNTQLTLLKVSLKKKNFINLKKKCSDIIPNLDAYFFKKNIKMFCRYF